MLQAHLKGLLHVFATTSLPWCEELAEKLVARAAKDLASSTAHALPGVLTVILCVCTCASVFVCLGHSTCKPLPTNPGTSLQLLLAKWVTKRVYNNVSNVSFPFEVRHDMTQIGAKVIIKRLTRDLLVTRATPPALFMIPCDSRHDLAANANPPVHPRAASLKNPKNVKHLRQSKMVRCSGAQPQRSCLTCQSAGLDRSFGHHAPVVRKTCMVVPLGVLHNVRRPQRHGS